MSLPPISWTIAGLPVVLEDGWTCNGIAQGGFDRMAGTITEKSWHTLRGQVSQGSVVKGWIDGAEPLWEGRLATLADISEGKASVAAMGYQVKLEKKVERLFIQSRDMSIWQPTDGEPFLDGSGNPVYDVYRKLDVSVGNRIRVRVPPNAIAAGGRSGAVFYAEGVSLGNVKFTMNYDAADETADFEVRLARADGPTGASSNVNVWVCGTGNRGTTKSEDISAANNDLVILYIEAVSANTPAQPLAYSMARCVVNSQIELTDTFHAWEVIDYIGTQSAFDTTGVVQATYNVLPFDFDGDWAAAADYVAELEDRHWGIYDDAGDGPRMVYDDFGSKTWQVYLSHGAEESLAPMEVFNKARVFYESPNGVVRHVTATASPDPLAAAGVTNTYDFDLEDRQASSTFPGNVAAKLAAKMSRQRYAGKLTLFNAWDEQGRDNPYGIRPGDHITIADFGPGESLTQRVIEVEYRHDRVEVGVEKPINLVHLLDALQRRRRKARRRRRNN